MRPIDAESPQNRIYVSDFVIKEMKKIPTTDAVPVTRCKDCRLGEPDLSLNGGEDEVWCNYYDYPKPADGFCEKGKRRSDEQ